MRAAALLRRSSRLCRRLAAPGCLAATANRQLRHREEHRVVEKKLAAEEKEVVTALPMVAVLAVELAVLSSDESSAGQR